MHPFNNEKRKPKLVLLLWMVELPLFLLLEKSGSHLDTLCLKTSQWEWFLQGTILPKVWWSGCNLSHNMRSSCSAWPVWWLSADLQMLLHHNKTLCSYSPWSLRAEGVQNEHCRNKIDIFTSYNLCWDQLVTLLLLLRISSNKSNSSSCVNSLGEEMMGPSSSAEVCERGKKNAPQSWLPASCSSY